jgi:hypothetical protein
MPLLRNKHKIGDISGHRSIHAGETPALPAAGFCASRSTIT